jgi:hypothetical protein
VVVRIQHVRDAVQVLEARDGLRLDRVAPLIDLALLDRLRAQRRLPMPNCSPSTLMVQTASGTVFAHQLPD